MSESSIFEDILLNPLMDSVTWCETLLWSPLQIPSTIAPLWGDLFKHYGRPIGWRCISKYDLTRAFFLPTEVQDSSRALTRFFFSSGGIMSAVGCDPGNVIQMSCIMGLAAPPPTNPVRGEHSACEHCRRERALCGPLAGQTMVFLRTRSARRKNAIFSASKLVLKVLLRIILCKSHFFLFRGPAFLVSQCTLVY